MYLFKSWGESLSLFKAGNLKLLFLVTLNNLRRHYKFFLGFCLLFLACDNNLWKIVFGTTFIWLNFIQIFLFLYMPFVFVLVLRPSTKRKSFGYLLDYKWHMLFWLIIPIFFIFYIYYGVIIIRYFMPILFNFSITQVYLVVYALLFVLPAKIVEIFFALFWLDSRSNFKQIFLSLWRAIKMFVFNLPIYFIFLVIPYLFFTNPVAAIAKK